MADQNRNVRMGKPALATALELIDAATAEDRPDFVRALVRAVQTEWFAPPLPHAGYPAATELPGPDHARLAPLSSVGEPWEDDGAQRIESVGFPADVTPLGLPAAALHSGAAELNARPPGNISGRQPAAIDAGDEALVAGFEAWLTERIPRLDAKTIKGRVSFLRKLAFVAGQSDRRLLEVDRALFENAARARFSASDYGQIIEGRASASAASTAKTAMRNFVEYVRAGIDPAWADPTRGASLPKASRAMAPKSIPWDDAEAFLDASAGLAQSALEAHGRGDKQAVDRFKGKFPLWPLRVVVGYVALLTFHLSGLRIAELIGLRTYDIVLGTDPCLLVFSAKNDKQRTVSIGPRLMAGLEWYLAEVRPLVPGAAESDRLLLDCGAQKRRGSFPDDAMRLTVEGLWACYAKGTAYEGTRWHPHIARHTYATGHLDHGTELRVVQAQLGHDHAETTAVYTLPRPEVIQRSAGTLDDFAGEAERRLWAPPGAEAPSEAEEPEEE